MSDGLISNSEGVCTVLGCGLTRRRLWASYREAAMSRWMFAATMLMWSVLLIDMLVRGSIVDTLAIFVGIVVLAYSRREWWKRDRFLWKVTTYERVTTVVLVPMTALLVLSYVLETVMLIAK